MTKLVSAAIGAALFLCGAGTNAEEPGGKLTPGVSLSAVPFCDHGSKDKFPIYIAIRNHGPRLLRVLPNKIPLVWGFFYGPATPSAKLGRFARGKEEQIEDLHSVAIVRTDTLQEGEEVCVGSGPFVLALAGGNEVLIETTVNFGVIDDGMYDVDLNLAALTLPEGKQCGVTKYERGKARITVEVKGDEMRLVGSATRLRPGVPR
jgi:hypothetical protein